MAFGLRLISSGASVSAVCPGEIGTTESFAMYGPSRKMQLAVKCFAEDIGYGVPAPTFDLGAFAASGFNDFSTPRKVVENIFLRPLGLVRGFGQ